MREFVREALGLTGSHTATAQGAVPAPAPGKHSQEGIPHAFTISTETLNNPIFLRNPIRVSPFG